MRKFDGKKYSEKKLKDIKRQVESLSKGSIQPTLASIYLGKDEGSALYTKLKKKSAEKVGIKFLSFEIKKATPKYFVSVIKELNEDSSVHGVLVQKPSGKNNFKKYEWARIVSKLKPKKDVDGLTPKNLGLLAIGAPRYLPATVKAILSILSEWEIDVVGKNVVIVGASEILGKPLSMVLADKGATVSLLQEHTREVNKHTASADILISAAGVPGIIKGNMVKKDSAVIDVGAPKPDVVFDEVSKKAKFIAPVPGGVGPVTVTCLLENLLEAAESVAK